MTAPPQGDGDISELIDDRALRAVDDDKLRHRDFAAELAWLATTAKTPSNIALYGRWGSGKTGLANLLESELRRADTDVKFVRFDAFKWAETPLRRHFLSQLAEKLEVSDPKFRNELYGSTTDTVITVPKAQLARLIGVFALLMLGILVVAGGLAATLTALRDVPFRSNFFASFESLVRVASVPAVVLTAFLAIAGQTIPVKRSVEAPSSDEEFERLFCELVSKVKCDRLVVFIDELDRCAPAEVVTTLETIKTFLDVDKCVFVVAADQQVMERALTVRARQATPGDIANPYYTSGSAYLDKVFHYQLSLPPLLPRRLTGFALDLVKERPGVWQAVDVEHVVSVLIPPYVRSPRRVKTLLNNFVLTYRLASKRVHAGVMTANLEDRAPELAKLVHLRTEFPLFAADIALDERLIGVVKLLHKDPEAQPPETIAPSVVRLARRYAQLDLPVDEHLDRAVGERDVEEPSGAADAPNVRGDETGEVSPDSSMRDVERAHAHQLLTYLEYTAQVPDPRRDLVYLEGAGATLGMDPAFADELETLAVSGRGGVVVSRLTGLSTDERETAVRLLAQRAQEASVGLEGRNASATLLLVSASLEDSELEHVASTVAEVVARHHDPSTLDASQLLGAWRLGVAAARHAGTSLASKVLARPEAVTDAGLADAIIGSLQVAATLSGDRAATVVAHRLADPDGAAHVAAALQRLGEERAEELVRMSEDELLPLIALPDADDAKEEAATRAVAAIRNATHSLIQGGYKGTGAQVLAAGMSVDHQAMRSLAEQTLSSLAPVTHEGLSSAILRAVGRRVIGEWPGWLDPIAEEAAALIPAASVQAAARSFANKSLAADEDEGTIRRATEALSRLVAKNAPWDDEWVLAVVTAELGVPETAPANIAGQVRAMTAARRFAEGGLVDAGAAANTVTDYLVLLAQSTPPTAARAPSRAVFEGWPTWVAERADDARVEALLSSIEACGWMGEAQRDSLRLEVAATRALSGGDAESPLTPDEVHDLFVDSPSEAAPGIGAWLHAYGRNLEPSRLWETISPAVDRTVPPVIAAGLSNAVRGWTPQQRLALVRPVIDGTYGRTPTRDFLEAARFHECDEDEAAELLIVRYRSATSNAEREAVMQLAETLRPVGKRVKQRLIEEVVIPLAEVNSGGLELAVKYLGVVLPPPHGTKQRLAAVLFEQAGEHRDRRRLEDRLEKAGLISRSGLLRRRRPVD